MPSAQDFPVRFAPLYDSPLVAIHDYVCSACRVSHPADGGDRGTVFRLQLAHVWTLREGRVGRFQQYLDILAMAGVLQA